MLPIVMALSQIAPSLIKYFSGSDMAATVAQQVIGIAQTVTGTQAPADAVAALQASPEMALEFQKQIMMNDADLTKAFLADVASARAMQVAALSQDDVFSKRFVYYFAAAWSIFAMCYFTAVTFLDIPPSGQRVADTILGVLITSVVGGILQFFFGSNKDSAAKTRLIAAAGKT